MPIRAVTFDFWNTLAAEPARGTMAAARQAAVVAACESHGLELDEAAVAASLTEVIRVREASWAEGIHLSPAEGAARLVKALGVDGETGEEIATAFLEAGRGAELDLAPEIEGTLARLREDGLALGIVCDAGYTGGALLRDFLDRVGLLTYFSGWGFSDEVGVYKPAPEIFEAALGMLGAAPAEAVHVGDLRRTDIAGARDLGMRSVRYLGLADDTSPGPEADFTIADHRELPPLVAGLD